MKVLFINVSSVGHVVPTLALVRELVRRDIQVTYLEVEQHRTELEAFGAKFRPLAPFDEYAGPIGAQIATLPVMLAHCAVSATHHVLEVIEAEKPDLVVHDSLCLWGRLAADLAGVDRVASIASAALSRRMLTQDPTVHAWKSKAGDTTAFDDHFARCWDLIVKRHGCPPEDQIASVLNVAPRNLVHLSKPVQPYDEDFGADYIFCGSGAPVRHVEQPFDWKRLEDRRVIFMSFGTAHDPGRDFYAKVAEAMRHIDATLVVVDSPSMHEPEPLPWPEGTIVCANGSAPQGALLERADLFISHVGGGAVREAAWMGTPVLGLPQTFEQDLFCHRLMAQGVAIRLADEPSIGEIASSALTMLTDNSFATCARALSATQHAMPPAETLATEIIIGQMK